MKFDTFSISNKEYNAIEFMILMSVAFNSNKKLQKKC